MGFVNSGIFISLHKKIKFNNITIEDDKKLNPKKYPCVYMWLSKDHDNKLYTPHYVGKAGRGLRNRIKQHEAGYKKNGAKRLHDCLKQKKILEVWMRISSIRASSILGVSKKLSMYSFEEEVLISKYIVTIFNKSKT